MIVNENLFVIACAVPHALTVSNWCLFFLFLCLHIEVTAHDEETMLGNSTQWTPSKLK